MLTDPEKDPDEIKYIINGIGWLNETADETYMKGFMDLSAMEQEALVAKVSLQGWGESWLSVILNFVFEALLCDPRYPGNPEGIGWKWLDHDPGQPRPSAGLIYPEVLTSIRKNGN